MLVAARLRLDECPHPLDELLAAEVDLADDARPNVVILADAVVNEGAIEIPRDGWIGSEMPEKLFAGEPLRRGLVSGVGAVAAPPIVLGTLDDTGVDGIEGDVADGVEQLGFLLDQSSAETALEEMADAVMSL